MINNAKHKLFADTYLSNGMNATQAYLSVYKSVKNIKTAEAASSRLLSNVKVTDYIQKEQNKASQKLGVTRDEIIADLKQIKDDCKAKGEYPPHALKAIEILNKMLGFNEPEQIHVKNTWSIGFDIPIDKDEEE